MHNKSNPSPFALEQLAQLDPLIQRAEKLRSSIVHPGKSDEFLAWRNETEMFICRNCGAQSEEYKKITAINFFPKWYKEEVHGTPRDSKIVAHVEGSGFDEDRKTAFVTFQSGLSDSIGVMKAILAHIRNTGIAIRPEESQFNNTPLINTSFNQSQEQVQQQTLSIDQHISQAIEIIEANYGESESKKAQEMLSALKKESKWSAVNKTAKWFLDLGRDAFVAALPVLLETLTKK